MHAVDLIIGDYIHRLPVNVDENAVFTDLKDAVQAGGGFVALPTHQSQATLAVLISPGVPVFIERKVIADEIADDEVASCADLMEWWDL